MHQNLRIVEATAESIRPFGTLVGCDAGREPLDIPFYKGAVKVYGGGEFVSDADTELTTAQINRRPIKVRWMERHFKHTQTFVPLMGRPFVMIMAPPTESELPEVSQAQALMFDGSCGFALHIGTWHEFPFALVDGTEIIVILRREATRSLMSDVVIDGEAHGPDLDKKDILSRLGVELGAALD